MTDQLDLVAIVKTADRAANIDPGPWDSTSSVDDQVFVDDLGHAYSVVTPTSSQRSHAVLIYSTDRCQSWRAVELQGRTGSVETRDGFNLNRGVTVATFDNYRTTAISPGKLWVERFTVDAKGMLRASFAPRVIAEDSITPPNQSGGANITLTTKREIYVVYPSFRHSNTPRGTATYIRRLGVPLGTLSPPILLGVAGDVSRIAVLSPDDHDVPAITRDRAGRLTVVFGAHHGLLKVVRSLHPDDVTGGWTEPKVIGDPKRDAFTYVSLKTDYQQTLHLFARWEGDGGDYHFQLVQLRCSSRGRFDRWGGRIFRVVAEPGRAFYVTWRQRLSLSPDGAIYLHFRYAPNQFTPEEIKALQIGPSKDPASRNDRGRWLAHPGPEMYATTLVSHDHGLTFSVFAAER